MTKTTVRDVDVFGLLVEVTEEDGHHTARVLSKVLTMRPDNTISNVNVSEDSSLFQVLKLAIETARKS